MNRFPKNLMSIYKAQQFRDYCLNPLGIKITNLKLKPKPQKVIQFVNFGMKLHRTEKPLEKNVLAMKIFNNEENITKPEIKQYLEKLYGLEVQKVKTLNHMGKVAKNHKGILHLRRNDYKKAYIEFTEEVDTIFQKHEKM